MNPIATLHPRPAVTVTGRADNHVHVLLTEDAAEVLAKVLLHYDTLATALPVVDGYDADLWSQAAVALLAAKASVGHTPLESAPVVYATRLDAAGRAL